MQSSNSYVGLSRVPTRLLIVGGMHVVVVWALINGLHVHLTTAAQPTDIVASMIDTVKPPPERFMPPDVPQTKVKLTDEPPVVPVLTEDKVDVGSMITESPVEDTYVAPTGWTADPEPVIDPRHPLTQPDYPMSSVHLDEQGKVVLSVLIGTDGRVTDVKVAQSSGSSRLDQAAVTEARAHWRLRPATRNGVPFEQWLTLGVVFRLENR